MANPVHFTILVPTRNRADTLAYCLRSLTAQSYPHFSVIVSDNRSADHTRQVVEDTRDPRVRYVTPPHSLSMRDNWEFALGQVQHGWVSVLGDDDGLAPGALEHVARVVEDHGVEAVTSSWCRYTWPGDGLAHASKLVLPFGSGVEIRRSDTWRRRVLSGAWRYIELPYLYTGGFVHKNVIDRMTAKGTRFFNAINPDIYSALAISCFVKKFAFIRDPIALRGTSAHSTGASSFQASTNQQPKLDFMAQNSAFIHPALQDDAPPISTHLFVYEAYLQATRLMTDTAQTQAMTDMPRQLAIVSALAKKHERAAISHYGSRMLDRAGVEKKLSFRQRLWATCLVRWVYLLVECRRVVGSALIDLSKLGIDDVFSAGVAARAIHWQMRHNSFLRVRRIWASFLIYGGFGPRSRT